MLQIISWDDKCTTLSYNRKICMLQIISWDDKCTTLSYNRNI